MSEPKPSEVAATRLAALLREINELEGGRLSLLKRVEEVRSSLLGEGQRNAALRGAAELLCEQLANFGSAVAELRLLEDDLRALDNAFEDEGKVVSSLVFEASGLEEGIDEAESELERISLILANGKSKVPRGH